MCSHRLASARRGQARKCLRSPGRAGKASCLPKPNLFIVPRRSAGSSGRTQTNGKADYDAVHKIQTALTSAPLSQWGKPYRPVVNINPEWDMKTPPVDQVEKLSAAEYFALFTELTKLNPPHANDYPILQQMRRLGIEPGKPFAFDKASPEVQRALTEAGPAALEKIRQDF